MTNIKTLSCTNSVIHLTPHTHKAFLPGPGVYPHIGVYVGKGSFLYYGLKLYNDLPDNFKTCALSTFRRKGEPLVRRRRLADDKKLDLKMKLQRVKKVVSLDAIGSYSIFRNKDRTTSLKAFGSTELWYDGHEFGIKKPGLGLQFTIYYDTNNRL